MHKIHLHGVLVLLKLECICIDVLGMVGLFKKVRRKKPSLSEVEGQDTAYLTPIVDR